MPSVNSEHLVTVRSYKHSFYSITLHSDQFLVHYYNDAKGCNPLADGLIQSELQMRRIIEAIQPTKRQQRASAVTSIITHLKD